MEKPTVFSYRLTYCQTTISPIEYNAFLDKFGGRGKFNFVGVKDDAFHAESICRGIN
jgi:hypothetical protein